MTHSRLVRVFIYSSSVLFFIALASIAYIFMFPSRSFASGVPASAPSTVRTLEIHIATNGLVLLRSARVVAVDGSVITVSTAWGSADLRWILHTNGSTYGKHIFGTRFLDQYGSADSLDSISVGNLVTVSGMLDINAGELTLDADSVRILE